jgi:ribosome-associated toxin RatA of RatAB toxin-antitoxin module
MRLRGLHVVLCLLVPLSAGARELRPPTRQEIQAAMPLLARGTVALVESDGRGWLKQVSIASIYDAPRDLVYRTMIDVGRYPEFLQNFSSVEVRQRRDRLLAYDWTWKGILFDFRGANMMTLTPGSRVDVRTTSGDLGEGRFLIDLLDAPGGKTLTVSTLFTDPRRGNWLARQLVARNPSMLHGMNLSVGMVFAYGMKARSEALAGHPAGRRGRPGGSLRGFSDVDLRPLEPLLSRGELALVETGSGGVLKQAAVFAKVGASADRVRSIVADPAHYPDYMSNIDSCDILERSDGRIVYQMEIDSPIFDIEGRMEQRTEGGALRIHCTEGDLRGGNWGWEFHALGQGSAAVYYGYTNMARANWVLRQLVHREPFFDHGLNVGSKLIMVRAVKGRAEQGNR